MKKISLDEVEQVFGGDCNCVGARYTNSHQAIEEVKFFGVVDYENTCRDYIANVTKMCIDKAKPYVCNVQYEALGCFERETQGVDKKKQLSK